MNPSLFDCHSNISLFLFAFVGFARFSILIFLLYQQCSQCYSFLYTPLNLNLDIDWPFLDYGKWSVCNQMLRWSFECLALCLTQVVRMCARDYITSIVHACAWDISFFFGAMGTHENKCDLRNYVSHSPYLYKFVYAKLMRFIVRHAFAWIKENSHRSSVRDHTDTSLIPLFAIWRSIVLGKRKANKLKVPNSKIFKKNVPESEFFSSGSGEFRWVLFGSIWNW